MKRLPIFILVWVLYILSTIPLTLFGVPLIAVLAAIPNAINKRPSAHYKDGRVVKVWRSRLVNSIWGNDEDGIDGLPLINMTSTVVQSRQLAWNLETANWGKWRRIFVWSALRNSTANLRYWLFFGLLIEPPRIETWERKRKDGSRVWWLGAQGYQAGLRWYYSKANCFWIGWKILPNDVFIKSRLLPEEDGRAPGAGFAFQLFAGTEQ